MHRVKIARSVVLKVFGEVEADSLDEAVERTLKHEDTQWTFLHDTAEPLEGDEAEVYWKEGENAPDPNINEPTRALPYAQARGALRPAE